MQSYTKSFTVEQHPAAVFRAITQPRAWWFASIEGDADRAGAVFYHHYEEVHHCVMKVTELVPDQKVVWHVLYNHFSFVKDLAEWNGTDIVFEIARRGDRTEVRFTHVGLVPTYECYDVCVDSWSTYLDSLRDVIAKGAGMPGAVDSIIATARARA